MNQAIFSFCTPSTLVKSEPFSSNPSPCNMRFCTHSQNTPHAEQHNFLSLLLGFIKAQRIIQASQRITHHNLKRLENPLIYRPPCGPFLHHESPENAAGDVSSGSSGVCSIRTPVIFTCSTNQKLSATSGAPEHKERSAVASELWVP